MLFRHAHVSAIQHCAQSVTFFVKDLQIKVEKHKQKQIQSNPMLNITNEELGSPFHNCQMVCHPTVLNLRIFSL